MIGAIVVLFNPDFNVTNKALESLILQVDKVCIVDNSLSDNSNYINNLDNIEYIPLRKNIGIAAAQNIGIDYFTKKNYDYVVFSDQDSIAPDNLISELFKAFKDLQSKGFKIAAVGPLPINRETSQPYITKPNIKRIYNAEIWGLNYDVYEMHSIISSLSLIKIDTFSKIGLFEEDLFIDGVDDEWCWRATHLEQLNSFIVPKLIFSHYQGTDNNIRLIKKKSTPFRTYYQFRNFIILFKRPYTPKYWKRLNLIKFIIKSFYYPCFISPRLSYLKAILRGCKDGLLTKI